MLEILDNAILNVYKNFDLLLKDFSKFIVENTSSNIFFVISLILLFLLFRRLLNVQSENVASLDLISINTLLVFTLIILSKINPILFIDYTNMINLSILMFIMIGMYFSIKVIYLKINKRVDTRL